MIAPTRSGHSERYARLDALRGLAVLWMVGFHFCFDLSYFRFTAQNFYSDPFWTQQRIIIVSLFLFCAGLGQAVAHAQEQSWSRFWKRWWQVTGCALLVTAGSWWVFGDRFISFGVLHALAVMLILLRLMAHVWPAARLQSFTLLLLVLGAACVALPMWWQHPFFDTRWTGWIGFATRKPATEDYVPLLPWLGVVFWGFAAGQWVLQHRASWLTGALPHAFKPLTFLGQSSLSIYMLHQPILFGLLMVALWLTR